MLFRKFSEFFSNLKRKFTASTKRAPITADQVLDEDPAIRELVARVYNTGEPVIMLVDRLSESAKDQPLKKFKEACDDFRQFKCDGSCNERGSICLHVFKFICPDCGRIMSANIQEMQIFVQANDDDAVCMECFETKLLLREARFTAKGLAA